MMGDITLWTCFCLILILFESVNCAFPKFHGKIPTVPVTEDPGPPLFLTPLIEQGKIKEAQAAANVSFNGFKKVVSYSGYFTVDKAYNSNLFFWFFPASTDYANGPVVLWLQGGPGSSSLIGLFAENGPFFVKTEEELELRKYSWTNQHSVLYIDSPVGTGYSFTNGGYCRNETKVGEDLYNAVQQFFMMFPELQKNEFYISGESYAGKYVPALGYTIMKNNPAAKLKINLQGLAIGNGWSDPEHQFLYGEYLYQIGLIDINTRKVFQDLEQEAVKCIQNKQFDKAFDIVEDLLYGDLNNHSSVFKNATGFDNYFNYLYDQDPLNEEIALLGTYVQRVDVRAAIHVGNNSFLDEDPSVEIYLKDDMMQSVAPWISELLSNYRMLIYNGQLDIIVAYPLTENYLQKLKFSGSDQYKNAKRSPWYVGDDLAGYVKQCGNLTEVLVRNAGHEVPTDQPEWMLDLITRFTRNKPFHSKPTKFRH